MNILIFGDNTRSAMVLKKLIELDAKKTVHFADFGYGPHSVCSAKNYCILPRDKDINKACDALLRYCEERVISEIIPNSDEAVELLRIHLEVFAKYTFNYLPNNQDLIFRLKDKYLASEVFSDLIEVGAMATETVEKGGQYFFKPRHSAFGTSNIIVTNNVTKFNPQKDYRNLIHELNFCGKHIIHKKHIGPSQSIHGYIGIDGSLSVVVQSRINEPGGGGGTRRVSVPVGAYELKIANRLKDLGWIGPFMLECRKLEDGRYGFVEFNPRFWGSLATSVASGLKLVPHYLNTHQVPQYQCGQIFVNTAKDLKYVFQKFGIVEVMKFIIAIAHGDFVRDENVIRKNKIKEATSRLIFSLKKQKFFHALKLVCECMQIQKYRINSKKIEEFNKIIFVCRGNIHRSTFAHHVAKAEKMFVNKQVNARSILRRVNRRHQIPSSVLKHYKLDIVNNSKPLLVSEVDNYTAVICFDFRNVVDLKDFGINEKNIFLLGRGVFLRTIRDPEKLLHAGKRSKQFDKIAFGLNRLKEKQ